MVAIATDAPEVERRLRARVDSDGRPCSALSSEVRSPSATQRKVS